jgi:hypothetical protein
MVSSPVLVEPSTAPYDPTAAAAIITAEANLSAAVARLEFDYIINDQTMAHLGVTLVDGPHV